MRIFCDYLSPNLRIVDYQCEIRPMLVDWIPRADQLFFRAGTNRPAAGSTIHQAEGVEAMKAWQSTRSKTRNRRKELLTFTVAASTVALLGALSAPQAMAHTVTHDFTLDDVQ